MSGLSAGPRRVTGTAAVVLAPNPGTDDAGGHQHLDPAGAGLAGVRRRRPRARGDEEHLATVASCGPVATILLTHGHHDHSEGAARLAELTRAPVRALDPAHRLGDEGLADGDVIAAAGLEIRVAATPGHSSDSLSFVLGGAGGDTAVLTGDTILGRGTTVVAHPDGVLADYLASLRRLRELGDVMVLPGPRAGAAVRRRRRGAVPRPSGAAARAGPRRRRGRCRHGPGGRRGRLRRRGPGALAGRDDVGARAAGVPAVTCPVCGTPTVPGARFCFACGSALAGGPPDVETERRVVTVLFGDLSDFTSWAEDLDPERVGVVTDRVLATLTGAVTEFGGHVDKLTGDGLMAVFGAPVAHEDDAERAVRARRGCSRRSGGSSRRRAAAVVGSVCASASTPARSSPASRRKSPTPSSATR